MRLWNYAAAAALGAAALGLAQLGGQARAQSALPSAVQVATTTVGATSHAWIVDPGTRQIIFCRADNASLRECHAMAMPDAARR